MIKMATRIGTLEDIPDDFGPNYLKCELSLRKKQKAKAFVSGCYLEKLSITLEHGEKVHLRGEIYPSQRKLENRHVVDVDISPLNKCIVDAYCSCKQGQSGTCSHTLAVVSAIEQWKIAGYKEVPALLSSTSIPQQWDKPRGPKVKAEPASYMIFASPTNIGRKRKPIMAQFTDNRKVKLMNDHIQDLQLLTSSPISYLVEEIDENTPTVETPLGNQVVGSGLAYHAPLMQLVHAVRNETGCGNLSLPVDRALNEEIHVLLQQYAQHWQDLGLSSDESRELERSTRLQASSKNWFSERQKRVTASNFGAVMNRKKDINDAFMKNTFFRSQFVSKATTYGHINERTAKITYINKTGTHLHDVGLIVNSKFPFLGASPDAIVCENGKVGLVEVKCPYSARNLSLDEILNGNVPNFFLKKVGGSVALEKKHSYFFQVQGQLLVSGLQFCDFVVYINDNIYIERIEPDESIMNSLLRKLCIFYCEHFKAYSQNQSKK
ncbi:uncharacterized protein LOC127853544 isoform X1 [Dreissena polymorpha]|uniref:SWIM-type domain-containing protein n=2 Tax=Dreissena polymorpha TaxID=45954 RepID=A0A9D4CHS5_DREPO|nr:uncharacterized protein LOC127853544 isoform X1 [Dreissena polymorpha]KAH3724580.1 hypothetical protein DPMN_050401 [Dreissena polymorpha]